MAYPIAEDTYITLEPEEPNAIRLEEFVKVEDIDLRYFEKAMTRTAICRFLAT